MKLQCWTSRETLNGRLITMTSNIGHFTFRPRSSDRRTTKNDRVRRGFDPGTLCAEVYTCRREGISNREDNRSRRRAGVGCRVSGFTLRGRRVEGSHVGRSVSGKEPTWGLGTWVGTRIVVQSFTERSPDYLSQTTKGTTLMRVVPVKVR